MNNCPEKISLKFLELSVEKCKENLDFWSEELNINQITVDSKLDELTELSNKILPCHTMAYENISNVFFNSEKNDDFSQNENGLLSADIRSKKYGTKLTNAPHMKDSIKLGHEIFLFAYHNIHNPYHRNEDSVPIRPIGLFLKKEIEQLTCVHGSPCDIAEANKTIEKYRTNHLDKFYLCPKDLRNLKPYEILTDKYLNEDFWYYFGNPESWKSQKGYGKKLFERAGEFRYLNHVTPNQIEAILWPFWNDDPDRVDENLDLYNKFKEIYPNIKTIRYQSDKYNDIWQLALVEASYYSQRYYIKFGDFESEVETAITKFNAK